MPESEKRKGNFFREALQLRVVNGRAAEVDQLPLAVYGRDNTREKGGNREPRGNSSRDVGRCRALGHLFDAAVRQRDVNLLHARVHPEGETLSLSAVFHAVKARQTNCPRIETEPSL